MKLYIYSYRDTLTSAYTNPFYDLNEPDKMTVLFARALKQMTEDKKESFKGKHLYCLGTFDDESGVITPIQPEFIAGE